MFASFQNVLFVFDNSSDLDLSTYQYELYEDTEIQYPNTAPYYLVSSPNKYRFGDSNASTFAIPVSGSYMENDVEVPKSYFGRVRAIDTSGNQGSWTALAKTSTSTPLIDDQYVVSLTAARIKAGEIEAAEIVLGGADPSETIIKSKTYDTSSGVQGWFIRGDGHFNLGGPTGITYDNETIVIGDDVQVTANLAADSISVPTTGTPKLNINSGIGAGVGGMTLGDPLYNHWYANGNFSVGSSTAYVRWNGSSLSVIGDITATSGAFTGTVTVGTNATKINIVGTSATTTTAIYSGSSSYGSGGFWLDASGRFSLGNKLTWNGSALAIDGTATIGGTAGSTVVSNAATGATAVQPAAVNANVTSISGGVITTGTINLNTVNVRTGTSGARLNIDSSGIKIYNSAGTNTVSLNSDGSASFTGSLSGATGTFSGTVTGGKLEIGLVSPAPAPAEYNLVIDTSGNLTSTGSMIVRNIEVSGGLTYRWADIPPPSGSSTPTLRHDLTGTAYRITRVTSTREIKDDIEDIEDGLTILNKLRPRKFRYKIGDTDPITGEKWSIDPNTNQKWTEEALQMQKLSRSYGFIVEEIQEIDPQLLEYDPINRNLEPDQPGGLYDLSQWKPSMYKYVDMIALCIKSIQQLCARIEYLESKLSE